MFKERNRTQLQVWPQASVYSFQKLAPIQGANYLINFTLLTVLTTFNCTFTLLFSLSDETEVPMNRGKVQQTREGVKRKLKDRREIDRSITVGRQVDRVGGRNGERKREREHGSQEPG